MQTHPVPQDIAAYQFKLVGDMTLKQFMFIAVGALLGLAVWKLPIPFWIIRFVLAIIPAGGGVLAAFVPINSRPFAQWVTAFFKAIYAPTIYEYETPATAKIILDPTAKTRPQKAPALSFTSAISQALKPQSKPTVVSEVGPPLIVPEATKPIEKTAPTVEPRETTTAPFIAPPPLAPNVAKPSEALAKDGPIPSEDSLYIPTAKPSVTPRLTPVNTKAEVKTALYPSEARRAKEGPTPSASLTSTIATPTSPNILTGLVVDPNQVSLPSATVEIIDSKTGIPTRALRTNRLGQFQIAIPLPNGNYTLQTEKDGFNFSPVSITVNNSIIKPVLLSAISTTITPSTGLINQAPTPISKF